MGKKKDNDDSVSGCASFLVGIFFLSIIISFVEKVGVFIVDAFASVGIDIIPVLNKVGEVLVQLVKLIEDTCFEMGYNVYGYGWLILLGVVIILFAFLRSGKN